MESERLARRLVEIADSKQAGDLVVLDMRGLVGYTDFLVVATARNERQAKAIVDEVQERLKQEDALVPGRVEGQVGASWVLLDYLDCVLHVFTPEACEFYRLESLWGEAPQLEPGLQGSAV
jgi:ribosome-associated protein